jgi:hypothetical protein
MLKFNPQISLQVWHKFSTNKSYNLMQTQGNAKQFLGQQGHQKCIKKLIITRLK